MPAYFYTTAPGHGLTRGTASMKRRMWSPESTRLRQEDLELSMIPQYGTVNGVPQHGSILFP